MDKLLECILKNTTCVENRKLIKISENRVAITVPKNTIERGKSYLIAIYINETDTPLILIRRAVKIGSSYGFLITSKVLRRLAEIPNIRVKICILQQTPASR